MIAYPMNTFSKGTLDKACWRIISQHNPDDKVLRRYDGQVFIGYDGQLFYRPDKEKKEPSRNLFILDII